MYEKLIGCIRAAGLAVHGFSPPEVVYWAEQWKLSIAEVIRRLIEAGLSSIPGGGAEILVDRVRRKISPINATAPGGWRSWPPPMSWA